MGEFGDAGPAGGAGGGGKHGDEKQVRNKQSERKNSTDHERARLIDQTEHSADPEIEGKHTAT